jgi:hypothetical protein
MGFSDSANANAHPRRCRCRHSQNKLAYLPMSEYAKITFMEVSAVCGDQGRTRENARKLNHVLEK